MAPRLPDPRIVGSGYANQGNNSEDGVGGMLGGPMRTLGALMKLKELHMEMRKKQQDQEDEDAIQQTMSTASNPEEGIAALWKTHPTAATKFTKAYAEQRKSEDEAMKSHVENVKTRLGVGMQMLQGVYDDNTLKTATPAIVDMVGPVYGTDAVRQMLGSTYDKDRIDGMLKAGMSAQERINAQNNAATAARADTALMNTAALQNINIGDLAEKRRGIQNTMASSLLESSRDQAEYDRNMKILHGRGVPDDILQPYGKYFLGDSTKQHARALGLTPEQKEQAADRKADNVRQAAMLKIAQDREDRLSNADGTGTPTKVGPGTPAYAVSLRARDEARLKLLQDPFADKTNLPARYLELENSVRQQNNMPSIEDEAELLRGKTDDPDAQKKLGALLRYVKKQTGAVLPGFETPGAGDLAAGGAAMTALQKAARARELTKLIAQATAAGKTDEAAKHRKELLSLGVRPQAGQ